MLTIYKREMGAYFRSPVAYCIIGFFMAIVGLMFWINSILQASAQFSTTLSSIGVYLTFIIPIMTMRLLSDEKKNGTEVLLRTCPVPMWKIDELVENIQKTINNSLEQEVTSKKLGEMVMEGLKEIDEVSYVRFASVYRSFKDISTFMKELEKKKKKDNGEDK